MSVGLEVWMIRNNSMELGLFNKDLKLVECPEWCVVQYTTFQYVIRFYKNVKLYTKSFGKRYIYQENKNSDMYSHLWKSAFWNKTITMFISIINVISWIHKSNLLGSNQLCAYLKFLGRIFCFTNKKSQPNRIESSIFIWEWKALYVILPELDELFSDLRDCWIQGIELSKWQSFS